MSCKDMAAGDAVLSAARGSNATGGGGGAWEKLLRCTTEAGKHQQLKHVQFRGTVKASGSC